MAFKFNKFHDEEGIDDSILTVPDSVDDLSPSQTGNSGKYLKTDGTNATWETVASGGYSVTEVTTNSASPSDTSGERIILNNYVSTSGLPEGYPVPTSAMLAQQAYYAIYLDINSQYIFVNFIDTAQSGLFDSADRIVPSCYSTRHMWLWSGSSWSEINWNDARTINDGNLFTNILANYDMKCQVCANDVQDHYPDFPFATYYTGQVAPTNNYPVPTTCTINLPTAVSNTTKFTVKNINTSAAVIDPNGSETVDGSATNTITTLNESRTYISDNVGWRIISKYTP